MDAAVLVVVAASSAT